MDRFDWLIWSCCCSSNSVACSNYTDSCRSNNRSKFASFELGLDSTIATWSRTATNRSTCWLHYSLYLEWCYCSSTVGLTDCKFGFRSSHRRVLIWQCEFHYSTNCWSRHRGRYCSSPECHSCCKSYCCSRTDNKEYSIDCCTSDSTNSMLTNT
jgi:hypothetical protein